MARLKFQEEEISRLSSLHEQLQSKIQECEDLKKQLKTSVFTDGSQVSHMQAKCSSIISVVDQLVTFHKKR